MWVVTHTDAKISASLTNLQPGPRTIEAYAFNKLGNVIYKKWSFIANMPPAISQITPADNAVTYAMPFISAKVSDADGIDPASISLKVDGVKQPHNYDPLTGIVSWTPATPYENNLDIRHNIVLDVKDNAGIASSKNWSFRVFNDDPVPPRITEFIPSSGSTFFQAATVNISAKVVDYNGINTATRTLTLNGNTIPSTYNATDDYSGTVNASLSNLTPGTYTLSLSIADSLGNVSSATRTIYIKGCTPEAVSTTPATTTVSSNVALTTTFFDWARHEILTDYKYVEVKDPNNITKVYDGTTSPAPTVSFTPANTDPYSKATESINLPLTTPGNYTVTMKVKDISGNIGTATWNIYVHYPPTVDQLTPADLSGTETSPPVISARVSDADGINAGSIKLTVDGVVRQHSYDPVTGIVSWNPQTPFPTRASYYPVSLEVKDNIGTATVKNWKFGVYTPPQLEDLYAITGYPQTLLNARFYDPSGLVGPGYIKFNGHVYNFMLDSFAGTGGGCEGEYRPPEDTTRTTMTVELSNLPDGTHSGVEVMATNALGVPKTVSNLSFSVNVQPRFSDYPRDYSITNNNQMITLKVWDPNGQINPNSIVAFEAVGSSESWKTYPTTYDPATSILTIRPTALFNEGKHHIWVNASDMAGNQSFVHFNTIIITTPPQFIFEDEGKTFYPGEPLDFKVDVKDFRNHIIKDTCNLKIDGNPIDTIIKINNDLNRYTTEDGLSTRDECTDGWYSYIKSSYTADGTLEFKGYLNLSPGTHELTATATDKNGNTGTKTWQFKVEKTLISDVRPQGMVVDSSPTVEAKFNTSEIAVDKKTIKLVIDNVTVQPQITEENGSLKVTYNSATLADGEYHKVTLSANDANHFRQVKSWDFCASAAPYPAGLSKPTPAQGGVNFGGKNPVSVVANNSNGTMDLNNAKITFTNLTANKTYQGVADVTGIPPLQKITGWYVVEPYMWAAGGWLQRENASPKPGLTAPLAAGNWRVTVNVPNKSNATTPYTLTWDFSVSANAAPSQTPQPSVKYAKPSGTTVSKKPTIMVGFNEGTILNSASQWVELLVDGQKINDRVVTNTTPYQDGYANIYTNPASIVYKPTLDLAEGDHTVLARCFNVATGETVTSKQWTFKVETTNLGPSDGTMEITSTNNKPCWGCHSRVGEKRENLRFLHPLISEGNWSSECMNCHEHLSPWEMSSRNEPFPYVDPNRKLINAQSHPNTRVDCTRCHGQIGDYTIMNEHPTKKACTACHMSDGSTVIVPDIMNRSSMNNCTSCHYSPAKVTTNHNGVPEFNLSGEVNHNMDDGHLSDTKGCTSCHSRILTKEHARPGRTDKSGNPINCNTCHDPQYKNEKVTLSDVSITLTTRGVAQKVYYPPKGKRITAWEVDQYVNNSTTWRVYALIDSEWVITNGNTVGYNNKTDGVDALMLYGQAISTYDHDAGPYYSSSGALSLTSVTLTTPSSDKMWDAIVNSKSKCDDCHTVAHTADHTSNPDAFCLDCHKGNLVEEHMDNETTQKGNFYTCDTCHKDNDRKVKPEAPYTVKDAIANHKRQCSDCHGVINHDAQHVFNLGSQCLTCHKDKLTQEHKDNPKTHTTSYSCSACHNDDRNKIVRSIQNNSLYCGGCHQAPSEAHNMTLADRVPADIPLYTDFTWTSPIEAAIFDGESSAPAGYQLGQVVLSNRQNIQVPVIWAFYNTQMAVKEWTLKTQPPASGATSFTGEFEKQGRFVTVKYFKTESRNEAGPIVEKGYRLEIWYTHKKPN